MRGFDLQDPPVGIHGGSRFAEALLPQEAQPTEELDGLRGLFRELQLPLQVVSQIAKIVPRQIQPIQRA